MKKYLMIVGLFMISFLSFAQEDGRLKINDEGFKKDVIRPLKIGDKVPDIEFDNVLNYKSSKVRLSDFKGKLIIFDFWNRYCSSCIASFLNMEKLQQKFGDKIQILLVTNDTREAVFDLMRRSNIVRNVKLPIVFENDYLYSKLFPHMGDPYHVWIGPTGRVIAMTASYNTTCENIKQYLENGLIDLKLHDPVNFGYNEPLFAEGNGRQLQHVSSYSLFITGPLEGYSSGYGYILEDSTTKRPMGIRIYNATIRRLYEGIANAFGARLLIEKENDTLDNKYAVWFNNPKWIQENTFSYELRLPPRLTATLSNDSLKKKIIEFQKQDFDRFYNIESNVEERLVKCFVLSKIDGKVNKSSLVDSIDNHSLTYFKASDEKDLVIRNKTISYFISRLQDANPSYLFFVNIKEDSRISLEIHNDLNDIPGVVRELEDYGFNLKEEMRIVRILKLRSN